MGVDGVGFLKRSALLLVVAALAPSCGKGNAHKVPDPLPDAPSNLTVGTTTSGRIDLTWTDNSNIEKGFVIERADGASAPFLTVAIVGLNAQAYSDLGLTPGTTYKYRVAAYNNTGYSPYAGPVTTATTSLAWSPVITGGPANGRAEHSAIYDTSTVPPRMIVFGGFDAGSGTFSTEVWSFTLAASLPPNPWSPSPLATTNSPPSLVVPGLSGHSAIYDPIHKRMVVFGGQMMDISFSISLINDVYFLDLTTLTWTKPTVFGFPPTARFHHSAVYDSANQAMIIFGGEDGTGKQLADANILDLSGPTPSWSGSVQNSGPVKREMHCAIYDPLRSRMVIFGGLDNDPGDGSFLNHDSWSFSGGFAGVWSPLLFPGTPGFREAHTGIYDAANQRMIVFGGEEDVTFPPPLDNDLWGMNLPGTPSWTFMPSTNRPTGRFNHSAIYDSGQGRMVIYGGYDLNNAPLAEVWVIKL